MPPAQVGVVTVQPQTVPVITELPGRLEALRVAQVRARVDRRRSRCDVKIRSCSTQELRIRLYRVRFCERGRSVEIVVVVET